jgi:hypothetical protein
MVLWTELINQPRTTLRVLQQVSATLDKFIKEDDFAAWPSGLDESFRRKVSSIVVCGQPEDPTNAIGTGRDTLAKGNDVVNIHIRRHAIGGEARGVDGGDARGRTLETHARSRWAFWTRNRHGGGGGPRRWAFWTRRDRHREEARDVDGGNAMVGGTSEICTAGQGGLLGQGTDPVGRPVRTCIGVGTETTTSGQTRWGSWMCGRGSASGGANSHGRSVKGDFAWRLTEECRGTPDRPSGQGRWVL